MEPSIPLMSPAHHVDEATRTLLTVEPLEWESSQGRGWSKLGVLASAVVAGWPDNTLVGWLSVGGVLGGPALGFVVLWRGQTINRRRWKNHHTQVETAINALNTVHLRAFSGQPLPPCVTRALHDELFRRSQIKNAPHAPVAVPASSVVRHGSGSRDARGVNVQAG